MLQAYETLCECTKENAEGGGPTGPCIPVGPMLRCSGSLSNTYDKGDLSFAVVYNDININYSVAKSHSQIDDIIQGTSKVYR
jgi:hypothetical protein